MREDWDVYFTHVDDKPASMLLDLGIVEEAPIPGISVLAYITVDFLDPDENGFSKAHEWERLNALEDAVIAALESETRIFVGRCTTNGQCDFFFYMDSAKEVEERMETAMAQFDEYAWDIGLVEEPGWDAYLEFLYPDEQGMDTIRNNRARRDLLSRGDDPATPREISHRICFSARADMEALIPEAENEGFRATAEKSPDESSVTLVLHREDAPDDIDDVTWPLRELAGAHGGVYVGWDCRVVSQ